MFFSKTCPSFLTVKEGVFLKSSRPSLPLKKAFSTSPSLLQGELHFLPKPLFLRKRGCNRPLVLGTATLQGWRTIKGLAILCGMGPPGVELTIIADRKAQSEIIILSTFNSILMIAWSLLGSSLYSIFIINLCCTLLCKIILHHISKGYSHIVLVSYTLVSLPIPEQIGIP